VDQSQGSDTPSDYVCSFHVHFPVLAVIFGAGVAVAVTVVFPNPSGEKDGGDGDD
jgi:hypothetical protein